jgi:hypothetical protein
MRPMRRIPGMELIMDKWSPENIGLVVTAIAGLVTAVSALIHSRNTRKGITNEFETSLDAQAKKPNPDIPERDGS